MFLDLTFLTIKFHDRELSLIHLYRIVNSPEPHFSTISVSEPPGSELRVTPLARQVLRQRLRRMSGSTLGSTLYQTKRAQILRVISRLAN